MGERYTPPPGWPPVPEGWTPPPGWQPDPSWPPAPPGWNFWQVRAAPAGGPGQDAPQRAVSVPGPPVTGRRRWVTPVIAIGTFLLGLIIGGAGKGGSDEPPSSQAESEPAPTVTVTADPTQEQQTLLDERSAELDGRQGELDTRQGDLDAREAAITSAELLFDQNNLQPGSYIVGTDIQPGTWRTTGTVTGLCYLGQNSGNDIMWNDISDGGQAIATVENVPGTIFEFNTDCGPMAKVG